MKTMDLSRRAYLALLVMMTMTVAACGDDDDGGGDTGTNPGSTPLQVREIIASPKSAAPGDTVTLTAVVTSSSANEGDIPTVDWSATGGEFVEDDLMSVQWVAPAQSELVTVTARATNGAGSATGNLVMFMGQTATVVQQEAGQLTLRANGTDLYYRRSAAAEAGSEIYQVTAGFSSDTATPGAANGFAFALAPDLSFETHRADSVSGGRRYRHVYIGDFGTAQMRRISVDRSVHERPHLFDHPAVSPSSRLVAYQALLTHPVEGFPDTLDIIVHDRQTSTQINVTASHPTHRYLFPTFSPDGRWLMMVSDLAANAQWDYYGMPMTGDVVDTDPANRVRFTTGAILGSGLPAVLLAPRKAWHAGTSRLALLSSGETLFVLTTTASGAVVDELGVGGVLEFVWSPDGSTLAVATGPSVLAVVPGGVSRILADVPTGDSYRDLAWSPDGEWLVYRVTRSASSWFELLDLDSSDLSAPVVITPAAVAGDAGKYRGLMSLAPVWGAGDVLFMPEFGVLSTATPGIVSLDVTSAIN